MANDSSKSPRSLPHWKAPVWDDELSIDRRELLSHLPFAESTTGEIVRFSCNDPFPFLLLPGELRNKIYGYVYSMDSIVIRNLEAKYYKPGSPRTEYEVMSGKKIQGKRVLQKTTYEIETSYTPWGPSKVLSRAFFFVNRQIQREIAPVIYTKRHDFWDVQAIVPYLQDQPCWARPPIKSIQLFPRKFHRCNALNKTWRKACWWIKRNMRVQGLLVFLSRGSYYDCDLNTSVEEDWHAEAIQRYIDGEEWVTHLVVITGLKSVRVSAGDDLWNETAVVSLTRKFAEKLDSVMVKGQSFKR